jgi:hypothetical protein
MYISNEIVVFACYPLFNDLLAVKIYAGQKKLSLREAIRHYKSDKLFCGFGRISITILMTNTREFSDASVHFKHFNRAHARIKRAYQQAKRFWLEIVLNFTEIGMFPKRK